MVSPLIGLVGGAHLLRAMGLQMESMLGQMDYHAGQLQNLADRFDQFSGMSASALGSLISSGALPAPMFMPTPNQFGCCCPDQYAPQQMDFGAAPPGSNFFQQIKQRRRGAKFERFLRRHPHARQSLEMMLGGKIMPDGVNDGRLTIQPFPRGFFPAGGSQNTAAFNALSMMDGISRAAAGIAGNTAAMMGPGVMHSAMLGALSGLFDGLFGAGGGGQYMPQLGGGGGGGYPFAPYGGYGNNGAGAYTPGSDGRGNNAGESVSSVLNDPSLTVEDKVTLMLMIIMKNMDKEIEKQAQYIEKIQNQQKKDGAGGGGGGGGIPGGGGGGGGEGGGGKSSPSIDVETMKLKRLIDKRSQMFDMLRQIIDKYNETAKNVIQSIGR